MKPGARVVRAVALEELREYRAASAADAAIELVEFPENEWVERDGRIVHRRANFFEVAGHRDPHGRERVIFRQPESALVGLLTAVVDGRRLALINVRAEPGLHGGSQVSTTIQSTPSNYQRRHGGRATPLIELFLEPSPHTRVLHESWQYDWSEYYDAKVKRFRLLETDFLVPVEPPLMWVAIDDLATLLDEDFAVTGDLRAASLMLDARTRPVVESSPPSVGAEHLSRVVPLRSLRNWRMTPGGIDEIVPDVGQAIRYVRVRARSREVDEWSQPLMVADDLVVTLVVRQSAEGLLCAVERRTAPGLRGALVWFPASAGGDLSGFALYRRPLMASAEGGRFLRHATRLEVVVAPLDTRLEHAEWMTVEQILDVCAQSVSTSLELRLVISTLLDLRGGDR